MLWHLMAVYWVVYKIEEDHNANKSMVSGNPKNYISNENLKSAFVRSQYFLYSIGLL